MRKRFFFFVVIPFFFGCTNKSKSDDVTRPNPVHYPYSAYYGAEYKPGNPEYTKIVLNIWKAYERKNLSTAAKYFTDEVMLIYGDKVFNGKKDSVITLIQKEREKYDPVQFFIESWLPVYSTTNEEDMVFLWVREELTDSKGKYTNTLIHEIWLFNKEGKISFMQRYTAPALHFKH